MTPDTLPDRTTGYAHYNVIPGWGYAIEIWDDAGTSPRRLDAQTFTHPRHRNDDEETLHHHAVHDGVVLLRQHGMSGHFVFETEDRLPCVPESA